MTIEHFQGKAGISKWYKLIEKCCLDISKPDFIDCSEWEVIFDRKIDVRISDEDFLSRIRDGDLKISGGDMLFCDLEITTETDCEYNPVHIEYTVPKVHGIKDKHKQLSLFD